MKHSFTKCAIISDLRALCLYSPKSGTDLLNNSSWQWLVVIISIVVIYSFEMCMCLVGLPNLLLASFWPNAYETVDYDSFNHSYCPCS